VVHVPLVGQAVPEAGAAATKILDPTIVQVTHEFAKHQSVPQVAHVGEQAEPEQVTDVSISQDLVPAFIFHMVAQVKQSSVPEVA